MLSRTLQYSSEKISLLAGRLTATKRGRVALPLLLGLLFCGLNLWVFPGFEGLYAEIDQLYPGGFFLAGLPVVGINLNMPFSEILISAALSLGIGPDPLFILLHLGVYALVFFTGCLLRGYWTGIVALLAAGLFGRGRELLYEQAIYTWFLLLVLALLLLQREQKTLKNSLLTGLAIGSSLLVRTPLFLFAPLAIFFVGKGEGEGPAAFLRRALVTLAACYALLLPWGYLNHYAMGEFRLFDQQRSANNVIIGAMGGIYSAYGNSWKAAGLTYKDSPSGYYLKEVVRRPVFHAVTVLRRLWHIFWFYPVFFILLLAAIARSREKDKALLFCLPVYLILVHSPLALEKRYFYPLTYLLPPLIAAVFLPRRPEEFPEARPLAAKAVLWALGFSFCAVLAVEALVLAYPGRAERAVPAPDLYARASAWLPGDKKLHEMKCTELWLNDADGEYRLCLKDYSVKFGERAKAYFLTVVDAPVPAQVPFPAREEIRPCAVQVHAARILRELELGDRAAALASFRLAYDELNPAGGTPAFDWQHRQPYKSDKELRDFMRTDTAWFWDGPFYDTLMLWPAQRLPKILAEISSITPLSPRLSWLSGLLKKVPPGGRPDAGLKRCLRRDVFLRACDGYGYPGQ
ncbi:MAG TPA: hypothetical protein DCZ92_07425 [Elusimicrobia bacterium]|nr:MAG: hypothetical protein A2016_03780 [Elusimicrobia bacterium GWF2_62_30]HBA60637.1 hypothetical protein [Elusimicrobiota bacterium]